ncbi:MAG: hypothetical protein MJK08_08555 [Campylobacterales bacterium]|nr:hypothetical protein [Campylobacterales bacterium]NQY52064.1 hypothetical protein [Campylobacteraceae bacterium]
MKKAILLLLFMSTSIFANKMILKSCVKTDISSDASIFTCYTGDYKVTYQSKRKKYIKDFEKIGTPPKIIQYITNK